MYQPYINHRFNILFCFFPDQFNSVNVIHTKRNSQARIFNLLQNTSGCFLLRFSCPEGWFYAISPK